MRIILSIIGVALGVLVFGQGTLAFEEQKYDFGEINEADGAVDHTFDFVNTGADSIRILDVKASCGCTTPAWTKEAIPPGGSGFITARYNPRNRPGAFRKSLKITTSLPDVAETLFISGKVKPKPRTVEDDLPSTTGGLRVKYLSFNLGKVTTEKPVEKRYEVYNNTDSIIFFQDDRTQAPEYIKIAFEPDTIPPKQKGKIKVTYMADEVKDLGFQSAKVSLFTSEEDKPKDFNVFATVEEYFPPMSDEELAQAPRLSFDKTQHNFGNIKKNSKVETEFLLTNTGKKPLNLRKIVTNCGCTVADIDKMDLQPNDVASMKVTFDANSRRGRQYKSVTVFSNDPAAPTQVVTIRAVIPKT